VESERYMVDYDLPTDHPGRRQFYRYIHKILEGTTWKKSSDSVIVVDNYLTATHILQICKAFNAVHAHIYKVVPLD
jgi:hypothetical protein